MADLLSFGPETSRLANHNDPALDQSIEQRKTVQATEPSGQPSLGIKKYSCGNALPWVCSSFQQAAISGCAALSSTLCAWTSWLR